MSKFIRFASGTTLDELEVAIADMLDDGFELYGSPFCDLSNHYHQPMSRNGDGKASDAYFQYINRESEKSDKSSSNTITADLTKLMKLLDEHQEELGNSPLPDLFKQAIIRAEYKNEDTWTDDDEGEDDDEDDADEDAIQDDDVHK